jgi:hypothetical protein
MTPALLVALQLIGSMGMAKHIPSRMSVMPERATIERASVHRPGRGMSGIEGASLESPGRGMSGIERAQRADGTRPEEDYLTMRRAAQTTYEPFSAPPTRD